MFTGIIEQLGVVVATGPSPAGLRLVVETRGWGYRPRPGDSIAVRGVCLTVAASKARGTSLRTRVQTMTFDVVPETASRTTLGSLRKDEQVHVEHALRADGLLGGHLVLGHVDGVGVVAKVRAQGEWRVRVEPPESVTRCLVPKGSVCIDGVSLTLAAVGERGRWFEVVLIPTTLAKTTLGGLKVGSRVNVEADAIAKQVAFWLDGAGAARGGVNKKQPNKQSGTRGVRGLSARADGRGGTA